MSCADSIKRTRLTCSLRVLRNTHRAHLPVNLGNSIRVRDIVDHDHGGHSAPRTAAIAYVRPFPLDLTLSTMSEAQRKELDAFISFFATFDLPRPVASAADLCDGAVLFDVLSIVCVLQECFNDCTISSQASTEMQNTSDHQRARRRSLQRTGSYDSDP